MTKDKILESAYRLFAINGYEGTSLSQIAKEVGIKKPSIYAHFSSKEEIFTTILDTTINKFYMYLDRIFSETKGQDTEYTLSHIYYRIIDYFSMFKSAKEFYSIILFFPPTFLEDVINTKLEKIKDKVKISLDKIFVEAMKNGEINEEEINFLIYSYLSLVHGSFGMMLYDTEEENQLLMKSNVEKNWNIYWKGIKK
ncbi:TetR/AcrR family transcriptional regulator [Sporosalibacterium faouarense]|uniref:TetR/AcrR family transcriptional regulator n=1 Tax=Sporosalibacterium faouarense TaxID=516123 RepID=UPI00141C670E|nr:TetR/AcrR family transcriptional regulator [Sporosalibacterium faouarense]MTI48830.1 TetR/AcrR family transcriptional regulator [Bacillota bacterium]